MNYFGKPSPECKEVGDHLRRLHIHELMRELARDVAFVQLFLEEHDDVAAGAYLACAFLKVREAARTYTEIRSANQE